MDTCFAASDVITSETLYIPLSLSLLWQISATSLGLIFQGESGEVFQTNQVLLCQVAVPKPQSVRS